MIAFYISSHGFGHLTRCLGHIEKYLLETNYNIYIVCGEKQIEFAKKYLNKYSVNRTSFKSMVTDIGLINKENSLEVDKEKLEKEKAELHAKFLKKIKELEDNLGIEPEPKSPPLTKEFDDGHVDWWREQT